MDTKEIMVKAAAHVVGMLNGTKGEEWYADHPMYEGICGWCGVMSPLNRPAFVAKFGEDFTKAVENEAKRILEARSLFWARSKAAQYEVEANTFEGIGDPGFLWVGSFVWGIMDGLKCDHEDLRRVFRHLIENKKESKTGELKPRLCRIIRIEEVEDLERDAATVLNNWKAQGTEGGSTTDDVSDEELGEGWRNYSSLTDEQKRTCYTLAVLVRDQHKRYILIDPEGYSYPRYVLLPKRWETMFANLQETVVADMRAWEEAAAKEKAEQEAAARAAYDERCAKWEGYMTELPAEVKGNEYSAEYRKYGKRNVLAMAKAAFPWVRFSVSYSKRWGRGYVLSWKNGPTVDEVEAATDFGLFEPWSDTFDGMTECAGYANAKFTDFSKKFGGVGNGVGFDREECEKDQNGDPNGKPPTPTKPKKGETAKDGEGVDIRYNEKFNGIELRFPSMPSEHIRGLCRGSGFRWSKRGFWYAHKCDRIEAAAEHIAAEWNNENNRAVA